MHHLELARDIAERMNSKYGGNKWKKMGGKGGRIFKLPDVFIGPVGARVMSLTVSKPLTGLMHAHQSLIGVIADPLPCLAMPQSLRCSLTQLLTQPLKCALTLMLTHISV